MSGYHGPYRADDEEARGLMSLVTGAEVPVEPAGEGTTMGPGYDGGRAAATALQGRRLELATRNGWSIRYDGAHDQFVGAKDTVAAYTLDELLTEIQRADAGKIGDGDDLT
jgi:hypothetical protein